MSSNESTDPQSPDTQTEETPQPAVETPGEAPETLDESQPPQGDGTGH